MAFTYDLTTDVGKVRMLIPDRVNADHFFEDDEITVMLALELNDIRCGTAMALETMASSEAYVQKAIRVLDLTTNGPATSNALLKRAAALRAQAAAILALANVGAFDIAELVYDDFSGRERIENEALRNGI